MQQNTSQSLTSEQIDIAKFRICNFTYFVKIYYSVNFDNFGFHFYKLKENIKINPDIFKETDFELIGKYPIEKHQITLLKNLLLRVGTPNINVKYIFENHTDKLLNRLFIDISQNACIIGGKNSQEVHFQVNLLENPIDYFNFLSAVEYGEKIAVINVKPYSIKFNKKLNNTVNNNVNQNSKGATSNLNGINPFFGNQTNVVF